ncbi:MAG TPA: dienelactone hydrolase family protein [Alphaproteobacteria bacterium]|nr:dienelactone hydrolase family protein [Alphaproteobacteria bacterium]
MGQTTVRTNDGTFDAYVANLKNARGPMVLLIQEIFGVNQTMRHLADDLSLLNYTVVCPDIFWRIRPGIQLNTYTPDEWKEAFGLFQKFDVDKGVEDLKATLAHMRQMPDASGKVGTVGYCLGGKLAYLMATRSNADCNVSYYGVGIQDLLGEAKSIKKPYLMHIAGKDQFVPPEAQAKIQAGLKGNGLVTMHVYPDQDHAFARVGGDHYDQVEATTANDRTAAFLKQHLSN